MLEIICAECVVKTVGDSHGRFSIDDRAIDIIKC